MSEWARDFDRLADEFSRSLDTQFGTISPRAQVEFVDVPSSDVVRMGQIFGVPPTSAGVAVTEASAMRVSAVYACVNRIASAIAMLPWTVYERTTNGRRKVDHDYWWLMNEQSTPAYTAMSFWEGRCSQMLLRGDGLAYLERDPGGRVRAMIPLKRENVVIKRDGKELVYYIHEPALESAKGRYFGAPQEDVIHIPGFGFDGVSSMSVISYAAREAIGIAIQADRFSGKFYGSNAHLQYVVKAPGQMTPEQQTAFREAFIATYGSSQGPTGKPLILTEGLDIEKLSMTAVDAQLLDARKWQVIDIARAFGVPPHMIGETSAATSWGTGIEQLSIGFVRYTLMPHLTRIAQEMNRKLWPNRDRFFVEPNVDALLEGDSKTQGEYFAKALGGPGSQGWMLVNEVRRFKNLPPVEGGDTLIRAGDSAQKEGGTNEQTAAADDGESDDGPTRIPSRGFQNQR